MQRIDRSHLAFEWPTLSLIVLAYFCYGAALFLLAPLSVFWAIIALSFTLTLHSSLQHETLHILEPRWPVFGKLVVYMPLGLAIPYCRFRDLHLKHHENENLTDPIDDPESFYMVPEYWNDAGAIKRFVLLCNNTLFGRIILGPAIGQYYFMKSDLAETSNRPVWALHLVLSALVILGVIYLTSMPIWAYILSAYFALSILKIRTFLEHQAEEQANARSVIIEDKGPLSLLFLNNNYHAAHHAHPMVPWYNLPKLFRNNRDKFLAQNRGYYYQNYATIFKNHFLKPKEQVPHPLWSLANRKNQTDDR